MPCPMLGVLGGFRHRRRIQPSQGPRTANMQFNGYDWQGRQLERRLNASGVRRMDSTLSAVQDLRNETVDCRPKHFPTTSPTSQPWAARGPSYSTKPTIAPIVLLRFSWRSQRIELLPEVNGRSRGTSVVQSEKVEDAVTAISKCTGYQYGSRPLGISHVRYTNISSGGEAMEGTEATGGLTQDQIM
ncbi:hypothetical protein BU16DRAFT_557424 [Lophium mytilinum]|uniref:Uncharacterized protein n=1 Tax=Lophium mytilinum TaxID=390894 RepID=A0A6A6R432_9PEZI|nr:hypothetical protein BU16DRAFT_557424 [Lophium mytilinum]